MMTLVDGGCSLGYRTIAQEDDERSFIDFYDFNLQSITLQYMSF